MEILPCIFLGIKVKPGPIERFKLENYTLDNTVDNLKTEAEKKTKLPSSSLELIHHGKILKESSTLQDSGVKNGEMVHVVKKKEQQPPAPTPRYSDAELQQLNNSLRTLGCTPNAPGWTRAMQLLNEEPVISEIIDQAPSLGEDCVALSILHEVELLAALGANVQTMRSGANAHHELPVALRHLTRLVRARASTTPTSDNVPTSGFAYSLEALSEDEDADEEESEETERTPITQEQLAAALQQAATDAVESTGTHGRSDNLMRLLRASAGAPSSSSGGPRAVITPEMFSDAITAALRTPARDTSGNAVENSNEGGSSGADALSPLTSALFSDAVTEAVTEALHRAPPMNFSLAGTPMEQSTEASSSQSPLPSDVDYSSQLTDMHEMGLLDDTLNVRALLICAGDVNAAINLVFSGAIGDD